MTVPLSYNSASEYLADAISFLETYSWIYREANTRYIKSNIFVQIPTAWIEHISLLSNDEFNQLPFGLIKTDWPDDLKRFFEKIRQLKPDFSNNEQFKLQFDPENNNSRGINPKKLHEITNLSRLILQIAGEQNVNHFIDVGCGLGYLTQFLYENNDGIKIYGLESDGDRVKTAKSRQQKYYKESIGHIHFSDHFIDDHSKYYIEKIIEGAEQNNFGLIGIHACGDLTINSIKLFHRIENIKLIIIMPCCYHKMAIEFGDNRFINIPLSDTLKNELSKINKDLVINRPFLRLASQQSSSKWKLQSCDEHDSHARNMFERAVIECALNEFEKVLKMNKTIIKAKPITYESLSQRYRIVNDKNEAVCWNTMHRDKINSVLEKYPDGLLQSEILTCLQTCLQSICENIVLLDKVCYINEIGAADQMSQNIEFYTKKIVSDDLSPRCYAFVGIKKH